MLENKKKGIVSGLKITEVLQVEYGYHMTHVNALLLML